MNIIIRRIFSEKLGTHYGLYLDDFMIHHEFSHSSAKKVAGRLNNGEILYEIIKEELSCLYLKKFESETKKYKKDINKLNSKYSLLLENKEEVENIHIQKTNKRDRVIKGLELQVSTLKDTAEKSHPEQTNNLEFDQLMTSLLNSDMTESVNRTEAEILAERHSLTKIESEELTKLLKDMKAQRFIHSSDLSNHIRKYKLGNEYPNISGVVKMQNASDTWDFNGGFPSNIYRIICEELQLNGKGTTARVIGFKSFNDLEFS